MFWRPRHVASRARVCRTLGPLLPVASHSSAIACCVALEQRLVRAKFFAACMVGEHISRHLGRGPRSCMALREVKWKHHRCYLARYDVLASSFVILGYRGEGLIEPSSSWFPPKLPSGSASWGPLCGVVCVWCWLVVFITSRHGDASMKMVRCGVWCWFTGWMMPLVTSRRGVLWCVVLALVSCETLWCKGPRVT